MAVDQLRMREGAATKTLADKVAEAILEAAADGRLAPGQRLIEADLAKQLNVSRVPVREALRLLESEGIVVDVPYREMRLLVVDRATLEQILAARLLIERHAVTAAVRMLKKDPQKVRPFEDALNAMREAIRKKSYYDAALADIEFHRAIYTTAGNPTITDMFNLLSKKLLIFIGISMYRLEDADMYDSHERLLRALKSGDAKAALKSIEAHIMDSLNYAEIS
jgi:DNA-binding GntR family transcriptional regulator